MYLLTIFISQWHEFTWIWKIGENRIKPGKRLSVIRIIRKKLFKLFGAFV
ncbi:MAG: hypothetical protein RL748_1863 [Pseudomonadota bacterium]|jgi:hypothetical protein